MRNDSNWANRPICGELRCSVVRARLKLSFRCCYRVDFPRGVVGAMTQSTALPSYEIHMEDDFHVVELE